MMFFRLMRRIGGRFAPIGPTLGLLGLLCACGSSGASQPDFAVGPPPVLPAGIEDVRSPFGAYLAGAIAARRHDDAGALAYYQAALLESPSDPTLASRVFILAVLDGRFDVAVPLAVRINGVAPGEPLANLVLTVDALNRHDAAAAVRHAGILPADGFYRFSGALARAWSLVAAWGTRMPSAAEETAALAPLDGLEGDQGLQAIKDLHTALIAERAGDDATAAAQYRAAITASGQSFRMVQLAGNYFARHGRIDAARALYRHFVASDGDRFGIVPAVIAADPPPLIADPRQGLAEGLFDLTSLISQSDASEVARLSIRLSLALRPDFAYARILLANTLIAEDRTDAALAVLRSIDPATPLGRTATLSIAQLLSAEGKPRAAEPLLRRLAAGGTPSLDVLVSLGDVLRAESRFDEAAGFYSRALDGLGAGAPASERAELLFSRGICDEQSGRWPAGEADLRAALALAPQRPEMQNYLGYALVVRHLDLPEATRLIKAAVIAAPNNGYYVDSLGWAYYQAGRYAMAAATLERAAELRPADAEINDHLGDAYWRSGRRDEARTAWRRALDYHPTPSLAGAIAVKLDRGQAQPF